MRMRINQSICPCSVVSMFAGLSFGLSQWLDIQFEDSRTLKAGMDDEMGSDDEELQAGVSEPGPSTRACKY